MDYPRAVAILAQAPRLSYTDLLLFVACPLPQLPQILESSSSLLRLLVLKTKQVYSPDLFIVTSAIRKLLHVTQGHFRKIPTKLLVL